MDKAGFKNKENLKSHVWGMTLIVLSLFVPILLIGNTTIQKISVKIMSPFFGETLIAAVLGLFILTLTYFFIVLYAVWWGRYYFRFVEHHPHNRGMFKQLLGTVLKLSTIILGWFLASFFFNMVFEAPS